MLRFAWLIVALLWSSTVSASFSHDAWDGLLKQHVVQLRNGQATQVDYTGMRRDRAELKRYLQSVSRVPRADFDRWSRDDRMAFLINVYNAYTVELVLAGEPGMKSIRDLGSLFQSPWKKAFIPLFGKTVSLDDIEHGMIRAGIDYQEPRIHFAVNCASVGCPALRHEAYIGTRLDEQLADQTVKFLSDRQRNRLRGRELEVSSIFKWYREDFEKGWGGYRSLPSFLAAHADALGLTRPQAAQLLRGDLEVTFLDYDWRLNRKP